MGIFRFSNCKSREIPPHGGHPCHSLTVPTAKPVVDFHHQVITHAGHTVKNRVV